jgi:hypothetical protein
LLRRRRPRDGSPVLQFVQRRTHGLHDKGVVVAGLAAPGACASGELAHVRATFSPPPANNGRQQKRRAVQGRARPPASAGASWCVCRWEPLLWSCAPDVSENVCAAAGGGGVRDPDVPCGSHLSCDACRANGCGWCIANRKCVDDKPWFCIGEDDHIGNAGTSFQKYSKW